MSPNRFAFVLRLWNESARAGGDSQPEISAEMRGSLHLSGSDEIVYFNSLHQIPELLQGLTGWTDTNEGEPPVSE